MYKFTGFTEKANTALNIAVETAEDLGHTYIGSEHLLIGLLRDTGGVACVALAGRGVTRSTGGRAHAENDWHWRANRSFPSGFYAAL